MSWINTAVTILGEIIPAGIYLLSQLLSAGTWEFMFADFTEQTFCLPSTDKPPYSVSALHDIGYYSNWISPQTATLFVPIFINWSINFYYIPSLQLGLDLCNVSGVPYDNYTIENGRNFGHYVYPFKASVLAIFGLVVMNLFTDSNEKNIITEPYVEIYLNGILDDLMDKPDSYSVQGWLPTDVYQIEETSHYVRPLEGLFYWRPTLWTFQDRHFDITFPSGRCVIKLAKNSGLFFFIKSSIDLIYPDMSTNSRAPDAPIGTELTVTNKDSGCGIWATGNVTVCETYYESSDSNGNFVLAVNNAVFEDNKINTNVTDVAQIAEGGSEGTETQSGY